MLDVSEIDKGRLWIGAAPETPEELRQIAKEYSISCIVDLNQDGEEREWCKHAGLKYEELNQKLADNFSPIKPDLLESLGELVKRRVAEGAKVFLHCTLARGRSPTVAAAYLMVAGEPQEVAVAIVKRARPVVWEGSDSEYARNLPQLADLLLLSALKREFGIDEGFLDPVSIWFSYGSNLHRNKFAEKMKKYKSNLTLLNPRVAALPNFQRTLGNESDRRCVAYTIAEDPERRNQVMGIVHEVPIRELTHFLDMEGVVRMGALRPKVGEHKRAYDVKKVEISSKGTPFEALALVGRLSPYEIGFFSCNPLHLQTNQAVVGAKTT